LDMSCQGVLGNGAYVLCPANNCGIFNQTFYGVADPNGNVGVGYHIVPSANGPIWVNAYGNEVDGGADGTDGGELPFSLASLGWGDANQIAAPYQIAQNNAPNNGMGSNDHKPKKSVGSSGYTYNPNLKDACGNNVYDSNGYVQPSSCPMGHPSKEATCHLFAVAGAGASLLIPGVDVGVVASWGIWGTGAAAGVAGLTYCW